MATTDRVTTVRTISVINKWPTRSDPQLRFDEQVQTNMNQLNTFTIEIRNFTSDINSLLPYFYSLYDIRTHIENVSKISGHVVAVSGIKTQVTNVGNNIAAVTNVSKYSANVVTVSNNIAKINTVAGSINNVNAVGNSIGNVNTIAPHIAKVNTVAGSITNVNTVAGSIANVNIVAPLSDELITIVANLDAIKNVNAQTAAAQAAANAAKGSENRAKASENAAKTSETNALASKNAAKTSETNAKASETAALASKNAAKTSETNAKASETAALASKNAAKTSETNAKASETAANAAKVAAEAARDEAQEIVGQDYVVKTRRISAGNGLTGGGDLSANRTLAANYSTAAPLMDGTATVGTSIQLSRGDHRHPSDTSKLSLSGGKMTGNLETLGQIRCLNGAQLDKIRLFHGDYGFIMRIDGVRFYFLVTAHGDPDGSWTSARPLEINLSSGICNINGNAQTATRLLTARTIALAGVITGSASFNGSSNVTINTTPHFVSLELAGSPSHGGFIDFHFGQSTVDYTSRIIEDLSGHLTISAAAGIKAAIGATNFFQSSGGLQADQTAGLRFSYTDSSNVFRAGDVIKGYGRENNGRGLAITSGGLTIIGGGEAPYEIMKTPVKLTNLGVNVSNQYQEEWAFVVADGLVKIVTQCQTWANHRQYVFTDGDFFASKNLVAGNDVHINYGHTTSHGAIKTTGAGVYWHYGGVDTPTVGMIEEEAGVLTLNGSIRGGNLLFKTLVAEMDAGFDGNVSIADFPPGGIILVDVQVPSGQALRCDLALLGNNNIGGGGSMTYQIPPTKELAVKTSMSMIVNLRGTATENTNYIFHASIVSDEYRAGKAFIWRF